MNSSKYKSAFKTYRIYQSLIHVISTILFLGGSLLSLTAFVNYAASSVHSDLDIMVRGGYIFSGTLSTVISLLASGGELKHSHALLVSAFAFGSFSFLQTTATVYLGFTGYHTIIKLVESDLELAFRKYPKQLEYKHIKPLKFMHKRKCCGWASELEMTMNTGKEDEEASADQDSVDKITEDVPLINACCCFADKLTKVKHGPKCKVVPELNKVNLNAFDYNCSLKATNKFNKPCKTVGDLMFKADVAVINGLGCFVAITTLFIQFVAFNLAKYIREID